MLNSDQSHNKSENSREETTDGLLRSGCENSQTYNRPLGSPSVQREKLWYRLLEPYVISWRTSLLWTKSNSIKSENHWTQVWAGHLINTAPSFITYLILYSLCPFWCPKEDSINMLMIHSEVGEDSRPHFLSKTSFCLVVTPIWAQTLTRLQTYWTWTDVHCAVNSNVYSRAFGVRSPPPVQSAGGGG